MRSFAYSVLFQKFWIALHVCWFIFSFLHRAYQIFVLCWNLSKFQHVWKFTLKLHIIIQYIPRNMHTVFALLCFVVVIHWLIFPYPSGLLHWHYGNLTIAPVPAKQPWWIWINTSCEFIMNDCITTTKQSTTKPCACFLGLTVQNFKEIKRTTLLRSSFVAKMMACESYFWYHINHWCRWFRCVFPFVFSNDFYPSI